MNLDGEGGDELLVTLAERAVNMDKEDNRLVSRILTFREGRLVTAIRDWPYYLRVIHDRKGRQVALAQKEGEYKQYALPIYRVNWNRQTRAFEIGAPYEPARNIYSIYQFNLVPEDPRRVIILEPNAALH